MKSLRFLALIVISELFYFSEGKPCPEKTRPHKSRCDAYFKCIVLPSKSHVWVPEKCEQGLIYEPDLRMCVLPGDDWECNLGESNKNSDSGDDNVVYGVDVDVDGLSELSDTVKDNEAEDSSDKNSESEDSADDDIKGADYISVDGGVNLSEHDFESSGDGGGSDYIMLDTTSPESKTNDEGGDLPESLSPTKIDPKLTAHLQRLTQLIDGLKQTYQSKESAVSDLRPDQLNAFLAHYNIKTQLDSLNPPDGQNAQKTDQKQSNEVVAVQSTTPATSQLDPETKVVLTNHLPNAFNHLHPTDGYSNSQIVVNKPEGSVLFTLGNQQQQQQHQHQQQEDTLNNHRYDPKISEDTLKTVLELSKQMIENQNVRQIIPNSAYYPQVVQPIYLQPPLPQYANSIFNHHDGYEDKKYDKVSSTYYVPQEKPEKPATTIIHNNVIPVHVSGAGASSEEKTEQVDSYGQKLNSYPPISDYHYTSGVSADIQDHQLQNRYENNQLVTIRPNVGHNSYNNYQYQQNYRLPTTTSRPYISDTGSTLTDYYTPSPHLDENNVNNVFQVERYPTINYGNIPSRAAYPQSNYNRNRPDQGLFSSQTQQDPPYYVNPYQQNYFYPNRQSILQLFPSHIDPSKVKIRPNSQKLESMEQETADDNDSEAANDQSATGTSDVNQSETYNRYNANKQIMDSQLAQYVEQLSGNRPQAYNSVSSSNPSRSRLPTASQSLPQNEDESQLANLAGNLYQYDLFDTKLLSGAIDQSKSDIINCPIGIRQPNVTDCTKYYVCSKEDGSVMQYSCPPYTAFNPQTRICDSHYYAVCHPSAVLSRYTVSENRRIQLEAIKALQDAKRIRDQAQQAQNIALRLRLGDADRGESYASNKFSVSTPLPPPQKYSSEVLSNFLQNAIETNSLLSTGSGGNGNNVPQSALVTQRPHGYGGSGGSGGSGGTSIVTKKRKYYCKEGDKVPDQTSIYSYFVCYKNPQGVMKGHKMTCSQGLLFCPMTTMCTLPRKCS